MNEFVKHLCAIIERGVFTRVLHRNGFSCSHVAGSYIACFVPRLPFDTIVECLLKISCCCSSLSPTFDLFPRDVVEQSREEYFVWLATTALFSTSLHSNWTPYTHSSCVYIFLVLLIVIFLRIFVRLLCEELWGNKRKSSAQDWQAQHSRSGILPPFYSIRTGVWSSDTLHCESKFSCSCSS